MKGFCQSRLQIATGKKQPITVTHPEIAAQWHPAKNGNITPDMVTAGCREMVWWLDVHGHEWPATVCDRTRGCVCPECVDMSKSLREAFERQIALGEKKSLREEYPEIAAQWHPTKNAHLKRANGIDRLTPDWVTAGCHEMVWWLDVHGHEWPARVASRTNGQGCPKCHENNRSEIWREAIERQIASGEKKSLKEEYPEIAAEWHPTNNAHLKLANGIDSLTAEWITARSGEYIWWLDAHGHEWLATVANRTNGRGCPECAEYGFTTQDKAVVYLMQRPDQVNYP